MTQPLTSRHNALVANLVRYNTGTLPYRGYEGSGRISPAAARDHLALCDDIDELVRRGLVERLPCATQGWCRLRLIERGWAWTGRQSR